MSSIIGKKNTIEQLYNISNVHNCSIIDAIIIFCEKSNIDIEDFAQVLKKDSNFVEVIKKDGLENRLLRESDGWEIKTSLEDFF